MQKLQIGSVRTMKDREIKDGEHYIKFVRLTHNGQFKVNEIKVGEILKGNNTLPPKNLALYGKVKPQCLQPLTCILPIKEDL